MIPVVAIGTSAGGLKEIESFFKNMPQSKEVAFVVIQHLAPQHKSTLAEIITRYTKMDVSQITRRTKVQPGKVYIIPPNKLLTLDNSKLILSPFSAGKNIHLPIDVFFRSMKDSLREKAIAVILSGSGSDGTAGIKEIKESGGLCLVQDPTTADYDGMPNSAIKTGLIDYVVPVEKMPELIIDYLKNNFHDNQILKENDKQSEVLINQIFQIIEDQTGNDFSQYKRNTIHRRIERRVAVSKSKSLTSYVKLLKRNNSEIVALSKELLISVTSFFRDKEVFEKIKNDVIPNIVKNCNGENIRIWVPACATGEEAFTLAMLIKNYIDKNKPNIDLQVFASDVDADAIEKAREGFYTNSIAADINKELLNKYFIKDREGFRVKKSLRELVIFAEHNLLQDPPYSKLDFISCRNVLIYLNTNLQSKAISIFNYALNKNGTLLLGNSESLGQFANYFDSIDRKNKIYKKSANIDQRAKIWNVKFDSGYKKSTNENVFTEPISEVAQHFLLENYTPPSVVIDHKGNMIYVQGKTGKYIENKTGVVSTDILKNVREGITIPLSNAIRKSKADNKENVQKNVRFKSDGSYELVDLHVSPLSNQNKDTKLLLVVFKALEKDINVSKNDSKYESEVLIQLERELTEKEHYLQNTIEELESTNEELKSSNEEAQSTNEELQSTNEELETSKEELQSVNEELATTNNELNSKIEEIYKANNDLQNLLNATNIATVFLDKKFKIFNFTSSITPIIELLKTDIGRSIKQFTNNLKYSNLINDAQTVLKTLVPFETEVKNLEGAYFWMRILPYRTIDDKIEGLVLTFTDITEKKKQEAELEKYQNHLEELVEEKSQELIKSESLLKRTENITHIGSWEWDVESDIVTWSDELFHIFNLNKENGAPNYNNGHASIYTENSMKTLDRFVKNAIEKGEPFETELEFFKNNKQTGIINSFGFPQKNKKGKVVKLFGSVQDITEQKHAQQALRESEERLRLIINESPFPIAIADINDERIDYWSHSAKKLVGYTPKKVSEWYEVAYPDPEYRKEVIERWKPFLKEAQESNKAVNTGEYHIACQDGSVKICELYAQFIPNNLVVTLNDITDRKKAEQVIIEKNAYIQRILDDFPIGIATNEIDSSKVIFINAKFSEIYGWPADDFPTILDFFNKVFPDKKYRERLQEQILADIKSGDPRRMHWDNLHITTKSGEKRIVNAFNIPFNDQNIMLSTVQDVTEQKKAEEALKHEKEIAQQYLDVASVIMVSIDMNGNLTLVNPKGCEILGYHNHEILGKNWFDLILPAEQREDVKNVFEQSSQGIENLIEYYENDILCKDGTRKTIAWHNSVMKNAAGEIIGIFCSGEDITIRNKAKEELLRNQHFLQKAQEIGSIGTWHIDIKQNILTWTEEEYKIIGIENNTPMNFERFMECVHPDDIEFVYDEWNKGVANQSYDIEHRVIANGKTKWVREKAEFIANEKGKITQAFGVTQDISEKKNTEEQLILAKKKAEENDQLKSAFLANMSHEIRTPMNGLLGFADLLRDEDLTRDTRNQYIDIIERQSHKLLILINDNLDLSKIESGQLKICEKPFKISTLISDTEATFNETKKLKHKEHLKIVAKIPRTHKNLIIKSDPFRIQQVLSNLMSNAIKFTDNGTIEFGFKVLQNKVHFYVKDEGIGIPKEKLPIVFKRFEQITSVGHDVNQGTGLGLAISKGIIELLNGKIEAKSEINKGTTFKFFIPLNTAYSDDSDRKEIISVNQDIIKGKKILIAEDDPINIDFFKAIFCNNLQNILFAKDGNEAVHIANKDNDIDVILMDLRMPYMDGYKATKIILEKNPKAKIIAQTAYAKPQDKIECLNQGFVDYISKPINKSQLFEKLANWI